MATWQLERPGTWDYPALGFRAANGAVLVAAQAPDRHWTAVADGPAETVVRYGVGTGTAPGYTDPAVGSVVAWSISQRAYVPMTVTEFLGQTVVGTALDARTRALTNPRAGAWPIFNYGASYSTLNQAFFADGEHWTQLLAAELEAGTVTSYGVNGRRALDVALALLNGAAMNGITGVIPEAKWPGTAQRSGLVVHDALGNDGMNQAAMNAATLTVQAIPGTTYLNYLKQTYRAHLALMSTHTRVESHAHTATTGTWTHESAGAWASGGTTCFTTVPGASITHSITPPQRGPLAGKAFVIVDGDIPTGFAYANVTTSIDGGAASAAVPTYRVSYTGQNGQQVAGVVNAIPVVLPVDGAAHTVTVTHAGANGEYLIDDVVLVPSEDPNPILCMGLEHSLGTSPNGFDAANLALYTANIAKVTAVYKEVIAEFPNAIYVPSTVTANGLWSQDKVHLNSRGNRQRKNDALAAVRGIKPRLDSRVVAQLPDSDFAVL